MEIISTLTLAVSPFVIKYVTDAVKGLSTIELSPYKKTVLRTIVAFFSFSAVLGTSVLNSEAVSEDAVGTFVQVLFVGLSATAVHLLSKKR